jgi:CII-binding regulator of phage lambda lysogenization HflD
MLNVMVNQVAKEGVIQGIKILKEKGQQIISQYANDTWLTFGGDEDNVKNVIKLLQELLVASSLGLN